MLFPTKEKESKMHAYKKGNRFSWVLLTVLVCAIAVPGRSLAEDKNAGDAPAKLAPAKSDAPAESAPELTERERLLLDRVEELEKRVEELESKGHPPAPTNPATPAAASSIALAPAVVATAAPAPASAQPHADSAAPSKTEKQKPSEPFAWADWTWLNGTARNKDVVWDSKFFTPEIRFDTHFVSSLNHPKDDSLGGSSEIFRSNEVQVEQISFGGDFHWDNVRGRVLTMRSATRPKSC